jgi:predicted AlkP superfamily phosphohydrolase/phosphomutase
MAARAPVLMVGIDASNEGLIDDLIARGRLPALSALRSRGASGSLGSCAGHYAGGVWPSFYTGQDVPWHGIYHNKLWRAAAMRNEVPTDRWLAARPFWEAWRGQGLRACIVDVPMILGVPRPLDGVYLGGWGTHDLIASGSWPPSLWSELVRRHGAPLMPREQFGRQTAGSLLRLREGLLRAVAQMTEVLRDLLARDRWDFACVVFGGVHRIGHYLTDLGQLGDDLPAAERGVLERALVEMYEATDDAIGRVLERVGPDARVVAFAVHGMGPNPGWADLVPDILGEMERSSSGRKAKTGWLYAIRKRVPMHLARPVLSRLPVAVTDCLVSLWSARMFDWKRTRYFPMPMDHAAYLRVSLRGRERDGIVSDDEYPELCRTLETFFAGLRDARGGAPIASRALRAWLEAPRGATHRDLLPDLVVPWSGPRAGSFAELTSDALPSLRYRVPRRLPSGRSGNHEGRGWFVAAGPGIAPGLRVEGHDILDLAPTVARWLGVEAGSALQGRPIDLEAVA